MARYRKLPIEVEMYCWQPEVGVARLFAWASQQRDIGNVDKPLVAGPSNLGDGASLTFYCEKSQAGVIIGPGSFVAIEDDGEGFYPIDAEVHATSYESVDNPT